MASLHTNSDAQHDMSVVRFVRSCMHTATYRKHRQPQVEACLAVQRGERCIKLPVHPGQLGCPRHSTHRRYQTNRAGESRASGHCLLSSMNAAPGAGLTEAIRRWPTALELPSFNACCRFDPLGCRNELPFQLLLLHESPFPCFSTSHTLSDLRVCEGFIDGTACCKPLQSLKTLSAHIECCSHDQNAAALFVST